MSQKTCSRCGANKGLTAFSKRGDQRYRAACKQCMNAAAAAKYSSDGEYRERCKARSKKSAPVLKTMGPEQAERLRAKRRERQRIGRIRGLPGYKPAHHDAHVRLWASYIKTRAPHDAHVRAFQALHLDLLLDAHVRAWRTRQKWKRYDQQATTTAGRIRRRATDREQLAESYIVRLLTDSRRSSREAAGLPTQLIELKRAHLRLVRFLNEAKETEA